MFLRGFVLVLTTATGSALAQIPLGADECVNADLLLSGVPSGAPFWTLVATDTGASATTSVEQQCIALEDDIWFTWQAPFSADITFDTCVSTTFDTVIGIWAGTDCATMAPLGCNDDGCAGLSSSITLPVTGGANYYIQIGHWNGASGSANTSGHLTIDGMQQPLGTNFCSSAANSQSLVGSIISADGLSSVAANTFTLRAGPMQPGEPGLFLYGDAPLAGVPFGEGYRCVGGTVVRVFPALLSDATGTLVQTVDFTAPGIMGSALPIAPGSTYHFQAWFRDPACPDCNGDSLMTGFSLSDGVTVTFAP